MKLTQLSTLPPWEGSITRNIADLAALVSLRKKDRPESLRMYWSGTLNRYGLSEILAGSSSLFGNKETFSVHENMPENIKYRGSLWGTATADALFSKNNGNSGLIIAVSTDDDHQDGRVWEAVNLAYSFGLENLFSFVFMLHREHGNLDGFKNSMKMLGEKYASFGWHVVLSRIRSEELDNVFSSSRTGTKVPTAVLIDVESKHSPEDSLSVDIKKFQMTVSRIVRKLPVVLFLLGNGQAPVAEMPGCYSCGSAVHLVDHLSRFYALRNVQPVALVSDPDDIMFLKGVKEKSAAPGLIVLPMELIYAEVEEIEESLRNSPEFWQNFL